MRKKLLKRRNFYFKQKKEVRKKKINVSQLAIRYFNDVTEKRMYPPYIFLFLLGFPWKQNFYVIFFGNKNISTKHFCRKQTLLFVIQLEHGFFPYISLIQKKLTNDSSLAVWFFYNATQRFRQFSKESWRMIHHLLRDSSAMQLRGSVSSVFLLNFMR